MTKLGLWLVEVKSRPGTVSGDYHTWTWSEPGGRRVTADNPYLLASRKSRALASLLRSQPAERALARRRAALVVGANQEGLPGHPGGLPLGESGPDDAHANPRGGVDWWTFAGGKANACLAAGLEGAAGLKAGFDNFAVRFRSSTDLAAIARAIEGLGREDHGKLYPHIDDTAVEGLKFSACLPRERAVRLLAGRMQDEGAIRAVLAGSAGLDQQTGG